MSVNTLLFSLSCIQCHVFFDIGYVLLILLKLQYISTHISPFIMPSGNEMSALNLEITKTCKFFEKYKGN